MLLKERFDSPRILAIDRFCPTDLLGLLDPEYSPILLRKKCPLSLFFSAVSKLYENLQVNLKRFYNKGENMRS